MRLYIIHVIYGLSIRTKYSIFFLPSILIPAIILKGHYLSQAIAAKFELIYLDTEDRR